MTTLLDPPVRLDGKCVVCRKARKPERSAKYAKAEAVRDPFCSNTCARAWHERERERQAAPSPIMPREARALREAERAELALEPGGAFERFET